jgi:hypothetical protein
MPTDIWETLVNEFGGIKCFFLLMLNLTKMELQRMSESAIEPFQLGLPMESGIRWY